MYRADVIKEENSSTHYRYELDRYVLAACELEYRDTERLMQEQVKEKIESNLQELKQHLSYVEHEDKQLEYLESFLDMTDLYKKYGMEKLVSAAELASDLFPRSFSKQNEEFQQGIYDYLRTWFEQLKSKLPPLLKEQPDATVELVAAPEK
ncbi:MAG: hypothetical protein Q4B28_04155 [bacterium]|nr:hypothetical protein [bacterium]